MNSDAEIKWIQAKWVLGLIASPELPEIATGLLVRGFETPSLVELAGLSRNEGGAADLFNEALNELECGAMEPMEALRRYAKEVSASILSGDTPPLEGARAIWRMSLSVGLSGVHDFDTFEYAFSEAEDRPQDRDFFEQAILEEAKRWHQTEL
jgi:hypothetical protein